MISGRQTLDLLDKARSSERAELGRIEQECDALNARHDEQRQALIRDYRELARLRIDGMARETLVQQLDAAERQVLALLARRREAEAALDLRIAEANATERVLKEERAAQSAAVDEAAKAVDEAEARTQAQLEAMPDYRAQRALAHEAARTARHADEKAALSAEEETKKGEAYRHDPLFMYLWNRKFGLPDYQAGPLFRALDGLVGRFIGFADARANFDRLVEIPKRLREHAAGLAAAAEAEFQALQERDRAARAADGIPALEAEQARRQAQLDQIDQRLAEAEEQLGQLLAQKGAFASGEDANMRQAVEYLAGELRREDVAELQRDALATPYPDDDMVVGRILDRQADMRVREASLATLKDTLRQRTHRFDEIECLRADFRRHSYDRAGSIFRDGSLVTLMIGNFLNGLLDRAGLWRVLQEQQRYQPPRTDPWFGSGGFGRGTVWGGGLGDALGKATRETIRLGRGGFGGGARGGFGGGFGRGGGFRTGGGF
jgi:hypothetical protein